MNEEYHTLVKELLSGPHAEALEWLRAAIGNRRTLGEHRTTAQGIALVEQLYELGAVQVLAVALSESPTGRGCTRYLLVELPEEARGRESLFHFEREYAEGRGLEGQRDEGQLYLFLDVKGID